jgi:hypothetical protein
MPTTELCAPYRYDLPSLQTSPSWLWASAESLAVDGEVVGPRTTDWTKDTGSIAERHGVADGRWLILVDSVQLPEDPTLDGERPKVAYVWNPTTKLASLLGRGYWVPYLAIPTPRRPRSGRSARTTSRT